MIEFSIICLVVIICILQHLLNWVTRKAIKSEPIWIIVVAVSMVSFLVTYICVIYIIKWGCQLPL